MQHYTRSIDRTSEIKAGLWLCGVRVCTKDFGCLVYGSARPSALGSLDRVKNAALRICLGAFRTSLLPSLHVEAGELPLYLRLQQLSLQYIVKLRLNP